MYVVLFDLVIINEMNGSKDKCLCNVCVGKDATNYIYTYKTDG